MTAEDSNTKAPAAASGGEAANNAAKKKKKVKKVIVTPGEIETALLVLQGAISQGVYSCFIFSLLAGE